MEKYPLYSGCFVENEEIEQEVSIQKDTSFLIFVLF